MLRELEPGAPALEGLLGSYLDSVASEHGNHGCYFVHVAKEHRGEDPEVQKAIRAGIARMRKILSEHMKVAQEQGILSDRVDPAQAALLMMAVAWGSHVLMEAGVEQDDALSAARVVFEMGGEAV